jgi:tripartite-type tricarboxylate transporter receptor subunit TctC
MPEIPTLAESGLPGFDVNPWFGLLVPAGTPEAVVQRLNRDINEALQAADVRERFSGQGAVPLLMTPAEFSAQLKSDLEKWARVVKESGARID